MSDRRSSVKEFNWNSPDEAKKEYEEFYAVFLMMLGSCVYIIDDQLVAFATPDAVGGRPAGAASSAAVSNWQKRKDRYDDKMFQLSKDFNTGISVLRATFPYGSAVRADLDMACMRPADVEIINWTPRAQFTAILAKLKADYSRSTATDIEVVRSKMMALSDQCAGGYVEYRKEFNQLYTQLTATGIPNVVSATELKEWVKRGIKNQKLFDHLVGWYLTHEGYTFAEVFAYLDKYMAICYNVDQDPYRTVVSASGKATINNAAVNNHSNNRNATTGKFVSNKDHMCTRCWLKGSHTWHDCSRHVCACCKNSLKREDMTCPKWKSHESAEFRFRDNIPPWERTSKSQGSRSKSTDRAVKRSASPSAATNNPMTNAILTGDDNVKNLRKMLKVAIKESRKKAKNAEDPSG